VVVGRARAVVVGVGANTAMGGIRDSLLRTDDVSIIYLHLWTVICIQVISSLLPRTLEIIL
jgi:hypothetical protein